MYLVVWSLNLALFLWDYHYDYTVEFVLLNTDQTESSHFHLFWRSTMIAFFAVSVLLTLLCGFTLIWAYLAFRNHRRYQFLPGPPLESFFLGNLPGWKKLQRDGKIKSIYMYDCHIKYGFTFKWVFRHKFWKWCIPVGAHCLFHTLTWWITHRIPFSPRMFLMFEPVVITCDPRTARELKNRFPKARAFVEKVKNFSSSRKRKKVPSTQDT